MTEKKKNKKMALIVLLFLNTFMVMGIYISVVAYPEIMAKPSSVTSKIALLIFSIATVATTIFLMHKWWK